ncbi:N(G)-N(G)-dimethylarginine dimethylaminohydrolase 1 isoform X1 [Brachionus plicatilis]|uniref:N(G)-N(G)-dimethylarginine dimethylaminohydrolase 1 isoform X1 n=1 Tax=Brachionus plicatilis TaxID=10195 RepID=A0A3M7Q9B5_BRAPC|nr:N(G)-N(G)-dimethylarginine dimethylaminohydrolase 1 isoform X1 [Brachionus plicatilis]
MMQNPFDFKYTHAIVCRVPNSLKEATFRQKGVAKIEQIDIEKAKDDHCEYVLTKMGIDVIELQSDDTLPDSTFIDCVSVICNGTALIAKPHLISRKKEVDIVKSVLKKEMLNIVEINDAMATLDGSDVFFTGREFFVGLSKRTNILGAKAVASAFPEYPVALIKLKKGSNQLKAYVSIAGPDILAVGTSEMAKDILKQMKDLAEYKKYQIISIPDQGGVNCMFVNSTLLHCNNEEFPNSAKIFAFKIDYPRIEIKNKEFNKINRYLTCRCILFNKCKLYANLSKKIQKIKWIMDSNRNDHDVREKENYEKE